jgi:transmembrane sensor
MENKDRIWYLISKKLAKEASADELAELEDLLRSHPEMHYALANITDLWELPPGPSPEGEEAFDRHLAKLQASDIEWQPADETPPPSKRRYLLTGTVIIVLLAAGLFVFYPSQKKPVVGDLAPVATKGEISTNNGTRTKITLPDGTQVWLNAESRITWANPFNNKVREVNLTGEAYFDVTHDEQRPFIVHTTGIDIRVLGTAFTVKSYESDNTIDATLLRGTIEVLKRDDPDGSRVILRPGQKLVFNKKQQLGKVSTASSDARPTNVKNIESGMLITTLPKNKPDSLLKETSWVYNKLVFDGDRFDELAAKMERWYSVQIKFSNERVKQYRFKGVFENESVQEALDALKLTAKFEYRISGNEIEIDNK